MYEAFFGLSIRPFTSIAKVEHYFPGAAIEEARQALARCIERAEGVGVVIGPSGTGKTLLCGVLAEAFKKSFAVALLSSGRLSTRRALLQAILFELGQAYRGMDEGELRLALVDYLTLSEDCPRGMLLLVDEAHTLPLRLLDEIRMITNLVSGGEPRSRLVVAGGPVLEERFANPKLESLSQRIATRCYLESFRREETQAYIHAAIRAAGREGEEVISSDACHAVYQATDGVPRLVNQVCDCALLLACEAGREQIDRAVIEESWAELQQLPAPWAEGTEKGSLEEGIIEFGGLDDEPESISILAEAPENELAVAEEFPAEEELPSVLRISAEPEEPDEPIEEMEQTEQALSEVDEEFQPAGSIGLEPEPVRDDAEDPFAEQFDEEEVIVARSLPKSAVRREDEVRKAACEEAAIRGMETLPAKEEPVAADDPRSETKEDKEPLQDEPAVADEVESLGEWSEVIDDRPTAALADEARERIAAEIQPEDADRRWRGDVGTVPMQRRRPAETVEADEVVEADEEMIIVEEGYDDREPVQVRPRAVRRQEYGQLFASLRRGR